MSPAALVGPALARRRPLLAGSAARRAVCGAGLAAVVLRLPLPGGDARWQRRNHRDGLVDLRSGPALGVAVALSSVPLAPVALAALGACAVGAYDDVAGAREAQRGAKGVRGHLAAARRGQVSAGAVKVVGIGAAAVLAVALLPTAGAPLRRRDDGGPLDLLLGAGVVAGSANLLNLFDLRPGRALKVGLLAAALLRQPGAAAAALVLLPGDLGERTMLGDAGANALGAALGLAGVQRTGRRGTVAALAGITALTAASEVVSYSRVIDAVAPLRRLDRLGRRA